MEQTELIETINALRVEVATLNGVVGGLQSLINDRLSDDLDAPNALKLLGLNNPRLLTYFYSDGLINRRKGGKGFIYKREELNKLKYLIDSKQIEIPKINK